MRKLFIRIGLSLCLLPSMAQAQDEKKSDELRKEQGVSHE